jgi:hypothetical protein
MRRHRMKILDNLDSQSLLAQMIILDTQIQDRFNRFADDPIPELQRWFAQPADHVALETLDFRQQWLELVATALEYYSKHIMDPGSPQPNPALHCTSPPDNGGLYPTRIKAYLGSSWQPSLKAINHCVLYLYLYVPVW